MRVYERALTRAAIGNGGILFVEAIKKTATDTPLALELVIAEKGSGAIVDSATLWIQVNDVESMFRHINLQSVAAQRGAAPSAEFTENLAEPEGNPDERTRANYFVFVHGYNVPGQASRGWNAEVFKRLYRLGFTGRFIGVNWHGDTGTDYHHAVYNAFQSSMHLSSRISAAMPEPGPLTVAGHSLGNVLVSNAIAQGGLTPDHYYLINAAAPIEAYDADQTVGRDAFTVMSVNMTEATWSDYPEALYAANWHQLFSSNDNRSRLTWRDRFSAVVPIAYNFYSPGEEVVENADPGETVNQNLLNRIGDMMDGQGTGRHAWVTQEIAKGCKNFLAGWFVFDNCTAGWNYNQRPDDWEFVGKEDPFYDEDDPVSDPYRLYSDTAAAVARQNGELTNEELAQFGYFYKFNHHSNGQSYTADLYAPINSGGINVGHNTGDAATASILAGENETQWDQLASGIPALSFAAAANPIEKLNPPVGISRNFDMESMRDAANGWPTSRAGPWQQRWLHSDFRNVALPYVYHTFEKMLEVGEFTE